MPAIVVLVGLCAFGLGRLSGVGEEGPRLVIYPPGQAAGVLASQGLSEVAPVATPEQSQNFVASVNGTKYYLPTCSGASRINEENKIWFATPEEAEAAGYGKAANCPGL